MDYDADRLRPILEAENALGQPDRSTRGQEVDYWCPFCVKRGFGHPSHIHVNYRKGVALCVAGDQRIITSGGLMKISEVGRALKKGPVEALSHDFTTGEDLFIPISRFFVNGRATEPYYRVITDVSGRYGPRVTGNHELVRPDGSKIRADALSPGDQLAWRYYQFTEDQRQIAMGTLLGDAHIAPVGRVMTFDHEIDQEAFASWKRSSFPQYSSRLRTVSDDWGNRVSIQSCVSGAPVEFGRMRQLFYPDGIKVIPASVLDSLSDLGLAVWFMDDGCFQFDKNGRLSRASLSVQGYDGESVRRAVDYFRNRGMPCSALFSRTKATYAIQFTRSGAAALARNISEYVRPDHHTVKDREKKRTKRFMGGPVRVGGVAMGPATVVSVTRSPLSPGYAAGNYRFCIEVPGTHNFYLGNGSLVQNCHQCGGWKSLLSLVRALYGTVPSSVMRAQMHGDLMDSLRNMLRKTAGDVSEVAEESISLPGEFIPFSDRSPKTDLGRIIWDYLTGPREQKQRGLPVEFLTEIGAGYCEAGRYKGYAVFPIHVAGELVTFTSRRVIATDSKVQHGSAAASRHAVFNYDAVLYGGCKRVFVGEGPFDGWAFHRRTCREDGGVAVLGKVLHDEQCRLLARLPCEELVMCLDDTEHAKTRAGAEKLWKFCSGTGKRVSFILLQEGSGDPHKNHRYLPWYIKHREAYDPVLTELGRHLL